MSREHKLTKWSIVNALYRWKTIAETARQLGVHRDTVYENMKRLGIDKSTVLGAHPTSSGSPDTPAQSLYIAQPAPAQPVPTEPEPERDIRRLTTADFSGACLGEISHAKSRPGSADELLYRYRRLRDK